MFPVLWNFCPSLFVFPVVGGPTRVRLLSPLQCSTWQVWLDGLDADNANTRDRYIYIHGTNQEHLIGQPASHGCIRLRNEVVMELFSMVPEGTEVEIA